MTDRAYYSSDTECGLDFAFPLCSVHKESFLRQSYYLIYHLHLT